MKWLSPPSGNSNESKADAAGATSYPFRIRTLPNEEASQRRVSVSLVAGTCHSGPTICVLYGPVFSKNFPKSLQAIVSQYCSMPNLHEFCLTRPGISSEYHL